MEVQMGLAAQSSWCVSTAQHNTTQHNTMQQNTTQYNTTQHSTEQHSTTQQDTVVSFVRFRSFLITLSLLA
jgi:hypothetical protein